MPASNESDRIDCPSVYSIPLRLCGSFFKPQRARRCTEKDRTDVGRDERRIPFSAEVCAVVRPYGCHIRHKTLAGIKARPDSFEQAVTTILDIADLKIGV